MESTLPKPDFIATGTSHASTIVYWIATALFCLQMSFTAYAELCLPQVAEAFTHLGFPDYFREELSFPKLLGQAPGRGPDTCAGAATAQGVGLGRLRDRPRLGADRSPRGGRRPGGLGLGSGHRRAVGDLVLLLAPPAPGADLHTMAAPSMERP